MNTIKTTAVELHAVIIDGSSLCYSTLPGEAEAIHGAIKQLHDVAHDCAKVLHEQGFEGHEWEQATLDNINGVLIQLGMEPVIIKGAEVSHD